MTLILRIDNADTTLALEDRQRQWFGNGGTIGRGISNDWVLPDNRGEISRVHAKINYEGGHYHLEDVSTNGVYLGSEHQRVEAPHRIQAGDVIHIGHYQIHAELEVEQDSPLSEPLDAAVANTFDLAGELDIATPVAQDLGTFDAPNDPSLIIPAEFRKEELSPMFIPEDWDAGVYTAKDTPEPPPAPPVTKAVATEPLPKDAAFTMMNALLTHFDTEYINACLSVKGGRDAVFDKVFNEAFDAEPNEPKKD